MRQRAALIGVTAARTRLVIGALDSNHTPSGTYDSADVMSSETACALNKNSTTMPVFQLIGRIYHTRRP